MNKLVVICGPMFAGKSTRLINEGERYAKAGFKVVYLKPATDTRYSMNEIVTHDQLKVPASLIKNELKSRYVVERADVILVDEVQFIEPHLIEDIIELANEKIVIVAGLDLDHAQQAFKVVEALMPHADEVIKVKGFCACGNETRYSLLKEHIETNEQVHLGADEAYEAVCRNCYQRRNGVE